MLTPAGSERDKEHYARKMISLDRQIDQLVYELYQLTPEEISIVMSSVSSTASPRVRAARVH